MVFRRISETELSVTAGLLAAWASYLGAERLHVSGVLSTVACGIVMGRRQHAVLSASKRLQSRAVWSVVTFVPEGFPGRDFILATTFAVIVVTVLVQGSTLAPLIRAVRMNERAPSASRARLSDRDARLAVAHAELEAVRARSTRPDGTERHPRLIEQYAYRIAAIERSRDAGGALDHVKEEHFAAVLAGIAAAREELLRLHHAGEIEDDVLHRLERDLDANEVRAGHHGTLNANDGM